MERLLARASELDVADRSGAAVNDLRAAAMEAGISASAFDKALAEMRDAERPRVPAFPIRRSRVRPLMAAAVGMIVAGLLVLGRTLSTPIPATPAMTEEAIVLRCLAPAEAAELIRSDLQLKTNAVWFSEDRAPHLLNVRGTRDQISRVKATLDDREQPNSPACTSGNSQEARQGEKGPQ
jgi:hypothetical protein